MKSLLLFLIIISSLAPYQSTHGALSPLIIQNSALKHHPTVLGALENLRAAEASVRGAHGAFDARIVSAYKRQTKHKFASEMSQDSLVRKNDYQTTMSRTQLEKPLRFANSKIYIGTEQISNPNGFLAPIYHTGNPTTQTGNYTVTGLKVSLLKNLLIDPDRAALKNAKFNAKIARADKSLTELDIKRLAQLAYWEWVTATKVKNVYEVLLQNGETRNEYLAARTKKGDVAQILVTENEQYVASRKGSLQAAKERLLHAEYALSLFYRNENGEPIVPNSEESFEDYPSHLALLLNDLDLNSNIDDMIQKRPDMKNLSFNVEKTEVDLNLAKQDLIPQLDLTGEYFERTIDHRPEMPYDYMMVLAQVTIPIELNLGLGNIAAARARQMVAKRLLTYGEQSYKAEVSATRKTLHLVLERVNQSEIEFSKTKELVFAENLKFKIGGGNLFLVNLREEAQAKAEASFHESRLAFMDSLLSYQALADTGE